MTPEEVGECLDGAGFPELALLSGQLHLGTSKAKITLEDPRKGVPGTYMDITDAEELDMVKELVMDLAYRIREKRLRSDTELYCRQLFGDEKGLAGRGVHLILPGLELCCCDLSGLLKALTELKTFQKVTLWVGQTEEERKSLKYDN